MRRVPSPSCIPCVVAVVVTLLITIAAAPPVAAQAPAGGASDDTPAAWLARAEKSAPPRAFLVHEHAAALMVRMGKPVEALDYLNRVTKAPADRADGYGSIVAGLLIDAHDGPACVALVRAMVARNDDLIYGADDLVRRLIGDGFFDEAGALVDAIEPPPPPKPNVRDDPRRRAGSIAELRQLIDRARTALADSPAPTPLGKNSLQEYDYACAAAALARTGQVDHALAMIAKRSSKEPRSRTLPLTRVLNVLLDQDKFDRGKVVAVLQLLEPQLGTDPNRANADPDDARLAVAMARARTGDRQQFQKHLDLFRTRHASDMPTQTPVIHRALAVEVAGRLHFNDLPGAKAALENVELTPFTDSRLAFGLPARAAAAAGRLDDFRPWIELTQAPEFRADSYPHACVGVAEGLWERDRRAAAGAGAGAAAKSP